MLEDAGAFAQHLDRADARAGRAEDVLLEDRLRGCARISVGDLRDEPRDVDSRGAGDRTRRGSVGAAALQAAVRLDDRLGRPERRPNSSNPSSGCVVVLIPAVSAAALGIAIRARPHSVRGKVLRA